jgi:hypothetical protein
MPFINLNQKLKRVEVKNFEIENDVVFNFFDNVPNGERDEKLLRAIYIGVLALMEDRLSSFLSKTSNELGTELESLKMIFEMKQELFYKTAVKGVLGEEDIAQYLTEFLAQRKLKDNVLLTGNIAGTIPKNKTGDIICEIDGSSDIKIVLECKFDKNIKLGDIESKDIFIKKMDTAWSQLIEAQANRDAKVSIIVFDEALTDSSIIRSYEGVGFIKGIGLISIINSQKGDYTNLAVAYMLARDIAINSKEVELDADLLTVMIIRIIKDINDVLSVKQMVESNIENNKNILKKLQKSMLLMEFNKEYMMKFLKDGTLSKQDLLQFYMGEEVKDKYKSLEKQINKLG